MAHSKSQWNALVERLAQCEYEREDARHMWEKYREENKALAGELAIAQFKIDNFKTALRSVLGDV